MMEVLFSLLVYPGMAFLAVLATLYYGIMRKVFARAQNRKGPPVTQPFYDLLKLFSKESIVPEKAGPGFTIFPAAVLVSAFVLAAAIPLAGFSLVNVDMIILAYLCVLTPFCVYMAGLSSGSPYPAIGAQRGFVQFIGYEFPFLVSFLVPFIAAKTSYAFFVVAAQQSAGWLAVTYPVAAVVFLITIMGKAEIPPFHVPAAKQELVGGYATELSGWRLGSVELGKYVELLALLSLFTVLFLGGSGNIWTFLAKTLGVLLFLSLMKSVFARFRIDSVFRFYWVLGFLSLFDLVRSMMA